MSDPINYSRVKLDSDAASTYSQRKQTKHDQEMRMIEQGFALTQGIKSCLDAPCGVGRASIWMERRGIKATGVDLGDGALALAAQLAGKAGVNPRFEKQDLFALPFEDRSFDAALCFRVLHHFESVMLQSRLIAELCRVSNQYVLISRITPASYMSVRRRLRHKMTGKDVKQYPMSREVLDAMLGIQGFVPVGSVGGFALFHSLQLHVYRRK